MNRILKRAFLPSFMAASLTAISLVPLQPAAANDRILGDAALGAGTCVVTGSARRRGTVLRNAAKCAAAGAAVNLVGRKKKRNLGRDAAVGAASSAGVRAILGGREDVAGDLLDGAAAGAAINILRR